VRGDDQPSRYPPRGVWFGLLILASCAGIATGQDILDRAGARSPADPVLLSARRVWRWVGTDGYDYVYLDGQSSALQGASGLRASKAVARISPIPGAEGRLYQVDVHGEDDGAETGRKPKAISPRRAQFRAPKVEMEAYLQPGISELKTPPRPFGILQRSGFLTPARPPAAKAPVAARPPQTRAYALADVQSPALKSNTGPATDDGVIRAAGPLPQAGSMVDPSVTGVSPSGANPSGQPVSSPDTPLVPTQLQRNRPASPDQDGGTSPPENAPTQAPSVAQLPPGGTAQPPSIDLAPIEGAPAGVPGIGVPNLQPNPANLPPDIEALPGPGNPGTDAPAPNGPPGQVPPALLAPITPGTQRVTSIQPLRGRPLDIHKVSDLPDGTEIFVCRGGVNIITKAANLGTIDIEADQAVIWHGPGRNKGEPIKGPNDEYIDDANSQPMEVYLEGNVVIRQDQRKMAGKGDQRTLRAPKVYYNFLNDRFVAHEAQLDFFAPSLLAPYKLNAPIIEQYHPLIKQPDGTFKPDPNPRIRADHAKETGSRFPDPGYYMTNRTLDLQRYSHPAVDSNTGKVLGNPGDPDPPEELDWIIDARQNVYWMGPIPAFFWPRLYMEMDDQTPPLRQFFYMENNVFGSMLLTDWNGFRLLPGKVKKPKFIDLWNVDLDYLSSRTKRFPALGTEIGWYGKDLLRDLNDPYRTDRNAPDTFTKAYNGYFDIWGLQDNGTVTINNGVLQGPDILGQGYAIITNGPPGAGKDGISRASSVPFQLNRGRFDLRHNQRFLPEDEDYLFQDLRLQLEAAYYTDRYFLEEYYKRLHDTGMDQETLAYGIYQKDNQAIDVWTEVNPMNWQTETQWLPRIDYYRLGDSLLSDRFTYYEHSGADYATTTTDIMVNNPNLFAYMPYDPVSNTSGIFSAGRAYTSHEIDMPLKFYNALRLVPYVQGQLVGWSDQLGGGPLGHSPSGALGRAWGGVGMRAETTLYKKYPSVTSEFMNVHGLNNKISLFVDARAAFSNVKLNDLAIQDDLDDNTSEAVRRYLAITTFAGGILPMPYDPRHLLLRQMVSPITGTTDVQASIDTVMLGLHQRLQTKRGPVGARRIVDYMTLDASSTYFPDSARDNFSTPWGQTMYNYQWYLGDRTSIVSQGWFEFFKLVGSNPLAYPFSADPLVKATGYNPNGLNIITSGLSIQRPPRSNIYLGYTIIDSGPIKTSALNASISYWLSPKWYGTLSESYDFGDGVNLGTMFSFTRIGADYLTSFGFTWDPQRNMFQLGVQMTPRSNGGMSMGSNAALSSFDTRFAPTQ
jgi:hypothetical protein